MVVAKPIEVSAANIMTRPIKWLRVIKAANDANQYDLMPGMILKIPVLEESAPVSTAPTTVVPSGPRSYKVQSGDNYYTIARDQLGNAQRYKKSWKA